MVIKGELGVQTIVHMSALNFDINIACTIKEMTPRARSPESPDLRRGAMPGVSRPRKAVFVESKIH